MEGVQRSASVRDNKLNNDGWQTKSSDTHKMAGCPDSNIIGQCIHLGALLPSNPSYDLCHWISSQSGFHMGTGVWASIGDRGKGCPYYQCQ